MRKYGLEKLTLKGLKESKTDKGKPNLVYMASRTRFKRDRTI